MSDSFNKKLSELFGKVDDKILQSKLNAALDMLKKGNIETLAEKINKMDKNELMDKINELDDSKLKELNINKDEFQKKLSSADFENLSKLLGENGEDFVRKIKSLLDKNPNS